MMRDYPYTGLKAMTGTSLPALVPGALVAAHETAGWKDVASCFDQALLADIIAQRKRFQAHVNGFIDGHPQSG